MADKTPAWASMLAGGIIVTGWTAIVGIIAAAAILLVDANIVATLILAVAAIAAVFVTCAKLVLADLRGVLHPSDAADVFPDIATGERCGTCYSNDRLIEIGYSCPDEWHDGPIDSDWRRIAAYISGIAVIGVWLLALFLYAAGVIK